MTVLITGGTGFIGSHTAVSLVQSGYDAVILDNLCNSSAAVLPRLRQITGRNIPFYQGDIRDCQILRQIFSEHEIESVIHFAGLKAVGKALPSRQNITATMFTAAWCWRKKWRARAC